MKKAIEYQNKIEQHLEEYRKIIATSLRTKPGPDEYKTAVQEQEAPWDTLTQDFFYSKQSLCDIITEEGMKHTEEKLKKNSLTFETASAMI